MKGLYFCELLFLIGNILGNQVFENVRPLKFQIQACSFVADVRGCLLAPYRRIAP